MSIPVPSHAFSVLDFLKPYKVSIQIIYKPSVDFRPLFYESRAAVVMKELIEEMSDSGYGCAVANRFGRLLDDESDPFDLLYQAQVKNEKRKKKEEVKKVVTSTKASKKESQRERKALVRVADNTATKGGGKILMNFWLCGIGACAVKTRSFPCDSEQVRSVLLFVLPLRSEEKNTWPSMKPSSVKKFLWATPLSGEKDNFCLILVFEL